MSSLRALQRTPAPTQSAAPGEVGPDGAPAEPAEAAPLIPPRLAKQLAPFGLSPLELRAALRATPELAFLPGGYLAELGASARDAGFAPKGFEAFLRACVERFTTLGEAARVLGERRSAFWNRPAFVDAAFEARRREALEPFLSAERRARDLAALVRERNAARRSEWARAVRKLVGLCHRQDTPSP